MNMNQTTTVQTVKYGTLFLSTSPEAPGFLCWRNMAGERVSRYYGSEADALWYCPK